MCHCIGAMYVLRGALLTKALFFSTSSCVACHQQAQ